MTRDEALQILSDLSSPPDKLERVAFEIQHNDTPWKDDPELVALFSQHKRFTPSTHHYLSRTAFALQMALSVADYEGAIHDLVFHGDVTVRRAISRYAELDSGYLSRLGEDLDDEVRMNVASHARAPSRLLLKFSTNDPDPRVRTLASKEMKRREADATEGSHGATDA
jgi:hypothetical protein